MAGYFEHVVSEIPRLLSHQDRDPHSRSYGCFDRPYWGWKFREFANATDQYALVSLAHVWTRDDWGAPNPYFGTANLKRWIEAGLLFWIRTQHRNGSSDQAYPNERGVGATFYVVSGICRVMELMKGALDPDLRTGVVAALRRAGEFLTSQDEDHGVIANHLAKNEMVLHQLAALCEEPRWLRFAQVLRARLRAALSREGWFHEYDGPDPAYQTQTLYYLMAYYERSKDPELLEMAQRAVRDFSQYFVHPDGSIGGEYGVRGTEIVYPAGFEMLRHLLPEAAAAGSAVRRAIQSGRTVILSALDFTSLIRVAANYFEAAAVRGDAAAAAPLPWEGRLARFFPDGRLLALATPAYYIAVNGAKGGVFKLFDKRTGMLIREDWGYTARLSDGSQVTSAMVDANPTINWTGSELISRVRFNRYLNANVTPMQMLVLRLLNQTVLRHPAAGRLFKRAVARRIMTGKRAAPIALERRLRFEDHRVWIEDRIGVEDPKLRITRLERGRRSFPIHMASARFYHAGQLSVPEEGEELAGRLSGAGELRLAWEVTID